MPCGVELVDLRWDQIDFTHAVLHVPGPKGTPATHPVVGDEMRALRKLQRDQDPKSPLYSPASGGAVHDGGFARMVERAGVEAKPGSPEGSPTYAAPRLWLRAGQQGPRYAGAAGLPRPPQHPHTVRYTELSPGRFKDFWRWTVGRAKPGGDIVQSNNDVGLESRTATTTAIALRFRLLQPVRHAHVAVHCRRRRDMLLRLLARARAQVDLAETEMAVGDEGAHAEPLGERQRLAIMSLAALGIELIGVGCDIAEQVQRMGLEPGLGRREFERAVAETPRLVETAAATGGAPSHG